MSEESIEVVHGIRTALSPVGERAGRRRSLDEHLQVRFPVFFRRLSDLGLRLPSRSRLRRLLLARAIVRAYAAANRRDFDLILTAYDPAVYEYRPSSDLLPPDMERVLRGPDGYRKLWRYWLDAFEDIRFDPEEMLDLGDQILVTAQQRGHGSGSGVAVEQPVFQLFKFRRGMVISQEDFLDRAQALAAAGLSEK